MENYDARYYQNDNELEIENVKEMIVSLDRETIICQTKDRKIHRIITKIPFKLDIIDSVSISIGFTAPIFEELNILEISDEIYDYNNWFHGQFTNGNLYLNDYQLTLEEMETK